MSGAVLAVLWPLPQGECGAMLLKLDGGAYGVLSLLPRRHVYTGAELLLLAVLAFQTARAIWSVLTPVEPLGNWQPTPVLQAQPLPSFDDFDPFFRAASADPVVVTSLGLTLLGTRVDMMSGRGSAIIATPDGAQASYSVGEAVLPGVTLAAVDFDGVTLARAGAREKLFLDQSMPPVLGAPTAPTKAQADPQEAPSFAAQLMRETHFTPHRTGGILLAPRGSGDTFRAAGFEVGDVLVRINGKPVSGSGGSAALAQALAATAEVEVEIARAGRRLTFTVGADG